MGLSLWEAVCLGQLCSLQRPCNGNSLAAGNCAGIFIQCWAGHKVVDRCVSSYGYEGYYATNISKVVVAFGFPRFFRQLRVYRR